jgi:hypothetical protein
MHTYIINTTSLTLYDTDMLRLSKGHPQGVKLVHFNSKVNKICYMYKTQLSDQRKIYYAAVI